MKKWFNTILFGDNKTKGLIGAIIVCSVLTVVLVIFSITQFSIIYGIGAVIFGVIDGVILQKYSLEDTEYEKEETKEKDKLTPLDNNIEEAEGKEIEINLQTEHSKVKETIYTSYGEKEIEELFKKYKVKQEHKRIIIDSCSCFRIRQCPAFIWKDKKCLQLLLLEKEPRKIAVPLKEIKDIYFDSNVFVKEGDYELFQTPSYIGTLFSPFLPEYFDKIQGKERKKYKNLYVIGPKLSVTNTSARNLFDILELEFSVDDTVMESARYSPYFKLAYKSYILYRDRVINMEEYKERIKLILTAVAVDEDSEDEYNELISQMIENKIITKEYGEYYRGIKDEL